jgi:drug/metabolite transporter (DMT)-like permease
MKQDSIIKGALLCLIAGITWGGQFPIAGKALQHIDAFYFTFIRYAIVSVILLIILGLVEGRNSLRFEGKILSLWFFGTMAFAVYNFLVFFGQKLAGPSGTILASVMNALIPAASVLVVWIYKKVRPSKFTMLCIVAALIGVVMVVTKGDVRSFLDSSTSNIFPASLMLIGVFAWAIYTVGGSSYRGWSPLRYTALSCILGTGSSLVTISGATLLGYLSVPKPSVVLSVGWELGYMSVVAGVIGVVCWNAGNQILTPINGSLFINIVPIVTFTISVITGYKMTIVELIGGIITIVALVCNNLYQRKLSHTNLLVQPHSSQNTTKEFVALEREGN